MAACATFALGESQMIDSIRSANGKMNAVQPNWMGPLTQPDSRLSQALRLSVASCYNANHTHTVNWGNYHTVSFLAGNRILLNVIAPPYQQNHDAAAPDGFGDTQLEAKIRLFSGNAAHGNFAVTGLYLYNAATGSHKNGSLTGFSYLAMIAGKGVGRRWLFQTHAGATLPNSRVAEQGHALNWTGTAQFHATKDLWLHLEEDATFNVGGPDDGKMMNFLTPVAFYVIKRPDWGPKHPIFVVGGGMQMATSSYHTYNHNLLAEVRILF